MSERRGRRAPSETKPPAERRRTRTSEARTSAAGTAPAAPPSDTQLLRAQNVALAVAAVLAFLTITFPLYEPDFWQHLAVGRVIWHTHHVPTTQLWSWPTYGAPDVNSSWGFRALVYPFWAAAGVWGLFAWRWLATFAAFALLVATARRMGVRGVSLAIAVTIGVLAWRTRSQIRPETLVAVLLALELWILETRRRGGPDRTLALPAIAWAWANSHISWHLGFLVLGAYVLDAAFGPREGRRAALRLLALGAAGFALSFVNPFGWRALWQPFDFFLHGRHEPIYVTIGELARLDLSQHLSDGAPFLILGWPVLLLARARRRGVDVAEAVLAVVFIALALLSVRFLGFLGIVAMPFLARDLQEGEERARTRAPMVRAVFASLICVALALPELVRVPPGIGIDERHHPIAAADAMERLGVRGKGYNTFSLGGYLLWRFQPGRDRLPFMDIHQSGTPEIRRLYTFSLEREEYWRELESKYPFDWALVARVTFAADRLPDFFDADSTWALVFQDDAAMLFVHRTGPMRAVAERAAYRVVPAGNLKLDGVAQRLRDDAALRAQFRAELERMTRESKWTSQARTLLAQLNLLEGKRAEAIEELDRAIEIDPHNDALRKDRAALKR